MDGFEINKVAGAVLTAMLVIASSKTVLDIGLHEAQAREGGLGAADHGSQGPRPPEPEVPFDAKAVLALLPKASADNGQDIFKKCLACHTPDKGGRNLVGPNLWGVVGRKIGVRRRASTYSDAMKGHPGEWTWEELAKYLHSPHRPYPATRWQFPGVKDSADLADLLVYLRKLSDTPPPLPQ